MNRKAIIGLLSTNLEPVPFYNSCRYMPVVIYKFKKSGIDWENKTIKGIMLDNDKWVKAEARFPDAVYNRCYSDSSVITKRLESIIGSGKVFNVVNLFDKHVIYNILKNSCLKNFAIPTYKYRTDILLELLRTQGTALIKPAKGSMGSGVFKITSVENGYNICLRTFLSPKIVNSKDVLIDYMEKLTRCRDYVIQPFIDFVKVNNHMFDIRMLVQKNGTGQWNVTADISRVCYKSSFVSNFVYSLKSVRDALEGTKYNETFISYIKKVSIKAAEILEERLCHIGEISVDFGIGNDDKLWIIEINGKPDKETFRDCSTEVFEKIYRTPIEYALYLAQL
ncbi:MAG TPA: hypothetical protein GX505_00900 [Clostridiales bacterium]|nr:hypothetical protein [Clostridiales bacterium]